VAGYLLFTCYLDTIAKTIKHLDKARPHKFDFGAENSSTRLSLNS
jgi:hypothetical protein